MWPFRKRAITYFDVNCHTHERWSVTSLTNVLKGRHPAVIPFLEQHGIRWRWKVVYGGEELISRIDTTGHWQGRPYYTGYIALSKECDAVLFRLRFPDFPVM